MRYPLELNLMELIILNLWPEYFSKDLLKLNILNEI